jgi:hypothetical protein
MTQMYQRHMQSGSGAAGAPARLRWWQVCAPPSRPSSAWPCGGRCQPVVCSTQPVSPTTMLLFLLLL